jgi:hypothetical protein
VSYVSVVLLVAVSACDANHSIHMLLRLVSTAIHW